MLSARQRYNKKTKEWELFNRFTLGKIASRKQKWENVKVKGNEQGRN